MSRHANIGLQMLMERRARDESNRFYQEAERADTLIKQRADFESRTFSRYQAGELKRRAKMRADQAEQEIDQRRGKLRQLLQQEDQQYANEVAGCIETPQKRRLRLMENLQQLRVMRQQEHDDYVKQKNEQAWRDQCDPLRHQISEALEKQIIAERDQQVIAREMARMEDDAEEAKYVEQVKENIKEWQWQQQQEREEKQMKTKRNREVWLAEMRAHQDRAAREKQQEYEESLAFRTTTEAAIRQAQEAAEEKERQQAARRKELDELNQEQMAYRKRLIDEEKALDLTYQKKAAEELRQEQEDMLVERLVKMRKAGLNAGLLATQLTRVAASNNEAERYLQQVEDECNRKEDELRAKDAAARRQLMLDAVADRVQTMKLHEQQREQRKADKELERQQLEEDLRMKRQLDQEEYETRRTRIHNQYRMLETQTTLKHKMEQQRRQEEKDSVAALVQSWKDEEARIQEELAHPHGLVGGRFRGHR